MNHLEMVICIIGFSLSTVLPRCLMAFGFIYRLPQRSVWTCSVSRSDDREVFPRMIFKDEESWMLARSVLVEKERLVEEKERLVEEKERLVEEKERVIEEKERLVEEKEEAKQFLKLQLKQKDELLIERLKDKAEVIEGKEESIASLRAQLLASNSRLTVRGVVEYFADYLKGELEKANFVKRSEFMSVTMTYRKAAEMAYFQNWSPSDFPSIVLLRDSYEKCETNTSLWNAHNCSHFFAGLYGELSQVIHGASWSGPKVLNTLKDVAYGGLYACVVREICKKTFRLDLVDVSTAPEDVAEESTDAPTLPEEGVKEVG